MRTVLTIGTFDTPHLGHAYLFKECERYGDRVVIGVNTDDFVLAYKRQMTLFSYDERVAAIAALGYEVLPNKSAGRELIDAVRPDVLVIGGDWARKDYYQQIDVDQDYMDEHGITMIYVPRTYLSSTLIKQRIT
jgi:D-beta-D-heptose 7-phosphate kinase/D-beta-D-heptose 1-phosphate adenosyltransferase